MPVDGAKMHLYDPWSDYHQSKTKNREKTPYASLIALVDRVRKECQAIGWKLLESGGVPPQLSVESISAILAWTARHGLLGVFHQTTPHIEDPAGGGAWTRAGGQWHHLPAFAFSGPREGICLVSPSIDAPDLERRGARAHLARFLGSDLPAEMPAPDSGEFFALYSEPLWYWIEAATTTTEAIFRRDDETLNVIASAAARVRWFEAAGVKSRIIFPSLLSAFAEMTFQDYEEGNLLGRCAFCGDLFITDRKWTTFCGPRCATRERQRRFRERNPEYYRKTKSRGRSKRAKVVKI